MRVEQALSRDARRANARGGRGGEEEEHASCHQHRAPAKKPVVGRLFRRSVISKPRRRQLAACSAVCTVTCVKPHTESAARGDHRGESALSSTNPRALPRPRDAHSDCPHPADEAVPWQERVDSKALTNMQARPVTPEQPLAAGGRARYGTGCTCGTRKHAARSRAHSFRGRERGGEPHSPSSRPARPVPPRPKSLSLSLDRSNCRRQPSRRTNSFKRRRQLRAS